MTPPTRTLLIVSVFVLRALEETARAQRGYCSGNQCFALFQDPEDFTGAQRSCRDSGGQLLTFSPEHVQRLLRSPFSGSVWLRAADGSAEDAAVGLPECPSISASTGRNFTVLRAPCHVTLDGFLCQYASEEPCGGLQAADDAQVKYTAPLDFELDDSETFPQGTVAVAGKLGGKYPDSKHVCFSSSWMRAPWNCEVLLGGCEHNCSSATHTCSCPAGKRLHPNNVACTDGPCEDNPCTGEGEECEVTPGGFNCVCKDGFVKEDGACVNVSICEKCEHMLCDKVSGVYECQCRKGFKVSGRDPTKCELDCSDSDCPARCVWNKDKYQCFCPNGYIQDVRNKTPYCTDIDECDTEWCDHKCQNTLGSFMCLCDEGFKLHDNGYECVPKDPDEGSGSVPPDPTPARARPAAVPSYVKTGSVLGIGVFMALCGALLFFLIRNAVKRCGKFELSSLKHPDIDIFNLQQVTTETYKRLSFDRQFKADSQRL